MSRPASAIVEVDAALLRGWPIDVPDGEVDKEARGRALVIAGSRETPGAALLAAVAALRAGAGKLAVAAPESVAAALALALPEARVVGLPETRSGGLSVRGLDKLEALIEAAGAVLLGPGLADERATLAFASRLVDRHRKAPLLLDALAIGAAGRDIRFETPPLLTPHAGEMAHLTGADKEAIADDPVAHAIALARRANAVVALKGATTIVAAPDGRCWRHSREVVGLATSGSGDVLAGIVAGLVARGADTAQAAVWGVSLHARAGEALARRTGTLGYLARELAAEVPRLLEPEATDRADGTAGAASAGRSRRRP